MGHNSAAIDVQLIWPRINKSYVYYHSILSAGQGKLNHTILELQNSLCWTGPFKVMLSNLLWWQGCLQLDEVAESPIHPDLECFQEWDTYHHSGQSVPCLTTLIIKKLFLISVVQTHYLFLYCNWPWKKAYPHPSYKAFFKYWKVAIKVSQKSSRNMRILSDKGWLWDTNLICLWIHVILGDCRQIISSSCAMAQVSQGSI